MIRPCIDCGEPVSATRCATCDTKRGKYDKRWRRLSLKARTLQPWCSDCGTTLNLTADHSPEAWQRQVKGLPIRLRDIDVVCASCNTKRGAARETPWGSRPLARQRGGLPAEPRVTLNPRLRVGGSRWR